VRRHDFAALGVPRGEEPADVAVTGSDVWVLFRPARLLRLGRQGERRVDMLVGGDSERWHQIAADPLDGSIWLVSDQTLALRHVRQDWTSETVKLQKKVIGEGGYYRVAVARDAIYAMPLSASHGIWRLARDGRLLGTAFPSPPPPEEPPGDPAPADPGVPMAVGFRLVQDPQGRVLFWHGKEDKGYAADAEGNWTEVHELDWLGSVEAYSRLVKGVDVGTSQEQWYSGSFAQDLVYWKGRPFLLGSHEIGALGGGSTRVLVLPRAEGGTREVIETCGTGRFDDSIVDAATDAEGFAALTWRSVLVGSFASAPNLP
jgi:hypothetical protein